MLGIEDLDPRLYLRRIADPLHRNSLFLILTSLVPSLGGVIFWLIVARVYSPTDVGISTALFPYGGLVASLATLGFTISLVRFLPAEGPLAGQVYNAALTLCALVSLLGALVVIPLVALWSPSLAVVETGPIFGASFVVFAVASTASALGDSALIARGRTGSVLVKGVLAAGLRIPLPLAFSALGVPGSLAIFSSFTLSYVVAIALGHGYLIPRAYPGYRVRPSRETHRLVPMVRFTLANHLAAIAALVPGALVPSMVLSWLNPQSAAYYYSAWIASGLIFSISVSASTSLLAEGSRSTATMAHNTRRVWGFILVLQLPAVIGALLLAHQILDFFQEGYSAAAPMFQLMALASFFVAFLNVFLTRLRVERSNRAVVVVGLLSSGLYLALAVPLIRLWGLTGVGAAYFISQGLTAATIGVFQVVRPSRVPTEVAGPSAEPATGLTRSR